ncbi:MAG: agmatinase, partial [Methanobacteriota archaeon]
MAAPRFADAVAKYDAARIALFGVPYDRTCSFRGGSRFAPRAIREASYNFETFMMDHQRDLLEVPV